MRSGMPFDDEVFTIIMGIDPSDPGMHGPLKEPCPTGDAVELVTKIRDMCEEWLRSAGKCETPAPEVGDTDSDDKPDKEDVEE